MIALIKRFEQFVRTHDLLCWVVKVCLFFALCGLIGVHKPFIATWHDLAAEQRQRDPVAERLASIKVYAYIKAKTDQAVKLGSNYGPRQYFDDLVQIRRFAKSQKIGYSSFQIGLLQDKMMTNVRADRFSWSDLEQERDYRLKELEAFDKNKVPTNFDKQISGITWRSFLCWLIRSYLWIIAFVFSVYILRMAEGQGIIETILSGKRKFVFACVLWWKYYGKYPDGWSFREIILAAELRRTKEQLFAPLTWAERLLVQEKAASPGYAKWHGEYRQANARAFRHSFAVALLATVFILLFHPFFNSRAAEAREIQTTNQVVATARGPTLQLQIGQPRGSDNRVTDSSIAFDNGLIPEPQILSPVIFLWSLPREMIWRIKQVARDIIHVPLYGYSVAMCTE